MSAKWPMVKLGEVLTERREPPSPDALALGSIRIVEKIGFNTGRIQLRSGSETRTGMILIKPGDLVVSGINAAKGAVAIYDSNNIEPITATIHYGSYIPDGRRVSTKFLWWMLRSKLFQELLVEYVPGGIKTELKAKRLLAIPVPLPELDEQLCIVTRIEEVAEKVHRVRTLRNLSSQEAKTSLESFLQAFMDNFEHWGRFEEVITFKPRSGPSFLTDPQGSGLPVLMPSAVTGFDVNPAKVEYALRPTQLNEKDLLRAGDILIARGNKRDQVGNAGVVPPECENWTYANLLMRIQVDTTQVIPEFCIYWLRSPQIRRRIYAQMSGTNPNIQKINQEKILNLPFPTDISLSQQRILVDRFDALQAEISTLRRLQHEIANEIDSLLPAVLEIAFKGRADVQQISKS